MKFSIKDFFSKCDQIRSFLRNWSHSLKKSLMENFIFCEVKLIDWMLLLFLAFIYGKEKSFLSEIFDQYSACYRNWVLNVKTNQPSDFARTILDQW